MLRITSASTADLFDIAATRRIEEAAAKALPPHTLMQRAGLAAARLAMALAPHARLVWVACGPGNNGGDGFEAASQLQRRGFETVVTRIGEEGRLPADARASLQRAREAGVTFAEAPPATCDLAVDALLGIGSARPPSGPMLDWLRRMSDAAAPVLAIDTPSGLDADTGNLSANYLPADGARQRRVCLSLLTLKPGLFTAQGRDAAGELWFDDLGIADIAERPAARLPGLPATSQRRHASHKGSYGDVAVIGGAPGMAGAALLAGSAALHAGAGRVFVAPLDRDALPLDPVRPELMFRRPDTLDLSGMTVVSGCGGGTAVAELLPHILQTAGALVLDADALNCMASDPALQSLLTARAASGRPTVLTPHPLEAARLLGSNTGEVQRNRLAAARELAARFGAIVVLKGSGSVIAGPNEIPVINPTGNARLATPGTGDVLAGMVGAALAAGHPPMTATCEAVWRHGDLADRWPSGVPLTAGALAGGSPPL
ncbi:yjeF C-terminal region, hydroxyethylthiazole kinase-related/yjeF N-terminal region [Variovorax sp. HW608]|uniref:NAD(P)H-hydrate dehydratase n=1 Tax=Variovorax sp. HW608 TaxID=1034889 RepID=UPI00081F9B04|nr:NAD(P)H-hydrate dehydratase [Variovorax sp. HW608]SCK53571.1 yjeF C-terminal region, hydroxyethylthiazole kinase-related/yjeF N-terminal region [Variovorax sp. HW608]